MGVEHSYGDYTRYDTEKFEEFNKALEDFADLIVGAISERTND
jgi:hypothetical protein